MSAPVDVLAVMDDAAVMLNKAGRWPRTAEGLRAARAAVAELIEALTLAERELKAMRAAVGSGVLTDQTIEAVSAALARVQAQTVQS